MPNTTMMMEKITITTNAGFQYSRQYLNGSISFMARSGGSVYQKQKEPLYPLNRGTESLAVGTTGHP